MTDAKLFPCPFCRSRRVALTGGGRQFAHYRCVDCSEVWTAQSAGPRAGRDPSRKLATASRNARQDEQ